MSVWGHRVGHQQLQGRTGKRERRGGRELNCTKVSGGYDPALPAVPGWIRASAELQISRVLSSGPGGASCYQLSASVASGPGRRLQGATRRSVHVPGLSTVHTAPGRMWPAKVNRQAMGIRCISSCAAPAARPCRILLGALLRGWGSVVVTPRPLQAGAPRAPGGLCPGQDLGCSGDSVPTALGCPWTTKMLRCILPVHGLHT